MILFPYAGDTRGGSVFSSYLLIEELLRRDRPLLLAFHGGGFARDLARERRLPHVDLPPLGSQPELERRDSFRIGNLKAALACRRVIAKHGVKVVHVNDKRMLRTWAIPARMTGRALIAHWRSVYLPSWSVDLGLRLTSGIVCVSQYSRDTLPAWARARGQVVYNPFKPAFDPSSRAAARRQIRDAAGIPADAAVIGFFGALLERKQPHMLLKIMQRLKETADGRPIYGIVCGETLEPRDKLYFHMLRDQDWQGRLVTAGFVNNVGEWMAACDVMIAPAIDEPLARVGVEAQSAGLPAIVSSDGGLREVVEDGVSGLVVDPGDFEAWVARVGDVLNDRDLARSLIDGGFRAAARLTVERHADAIDRIYDQFLPVSPRRPAEIGARSLPQGAGATVKPPFSEFR